MKLYEGSYSQAGQESFVLDYLMEKKNGFYLEIGTYDSKIMSNTYLLETQYGWSGVGLEIEKSRAEEYNLNRSNLCLNVDATKFNYLEYFENNNIPKTIDYLQIDIEPAFQSLEALKLLPLDKYRFSTITFEHDLYADENNSYIKQIAKDLLLSYGYVVFKENVECDGKIFEDWYVDSSIDYYKEKNE